MSVELPFAPVDALIRRNADGLRVSAGAAEELARRVQSQGAVLAAEAAQRATDDGRKTIMAEDFDDLGPSSRSEADAPAPEDADDLVLPIAPIDRIARLDIDDRYRVGMDARIALATALEAYADEAARGAALLARHADRRTIQAGDIQTYFALVE